MIKINKKKEKSYEFILTTESGHMLLSSIDYDKKSKAKKAAELFNGIKTPQLSFERRTNHQGQFIFTLKGNDGQLIGNSQPYQSEAGMENGIKNVINRIDYLSTT